MKAYLKSFFSICSIIWNKSYVSVLDSDVEILDYKNRVFFISSILFMILGIVFYFYYDKNFLLLFLFGSIYFSFSITDECWRKVKINKKEEGISSIFSFTLIVSVIILAIKLFLIILNPISGI